MVSGTDIDVTRAANSREVHLRCGLQGKSLGSEVEVNIYASMRPTPLARRLPVFAQSEGFQRLAPIARALSYRDGTDALALDVFAV
jgi:hypothetical protein